MQGCPSILRMDKGTENVWMATAQCAFRNDHEDRFSAENSIRYGSSPANTVLYNNTQCHVILYDSSVHLVLNYQRIESWWSQLRTHKTGWWIHALKEYMATQLYTPCQGLYCTMTQEVLSCSFDNTH